MTFEEIVDRAIVMLQRRKRVAYRTLKAQFDLDDDALEALKDELLYAQQVARDEDGRVLVWLSAPPGAPSSIESRTSEAERRQLTVLFCDLVESTLLAGRLDPEDLREVIRAYQATGAEVIQRFEGRVAQYLGDGLLVYFGYPQAHEDDAQRAIRAGREIIEAVGILNTRLEHEKGVRLAVRVGIHTGLVVVGEIGTSDGQSSWRWGRHRTSQRASLLNRLDARGRTLAAQGRGEEGITRIRQGMAAHRATGADLTLLLPLTWLAEAYGTARQPGEGLRVLSEAGAAAHNFGERWYEAERHRLKGDLLLALSVDHQEEAEACLHQALAVARRQQAKSWELRAAMSLSRLWQQQGKRTEARQLLGEIYGWFTEGFDTADLQEAAALLEALG